MGGRTVHLLLILPSSLAMDLKLLGLFTQSTNYFPHRLYYFRSWYGRISLLLQRLGSGTQAVPIGIVKGQGNIVKFL